VTRLGRGFVAVHPPRPVLDAIDARVAPLRTPTTRLRWLPPSQWHVTLQFLGPVHDAETLAAHLATAVAAL